ncbi:MAG TPA: elongation factor Ts [Bacteroidetes bacterium]|nr:elongation factor Ts [Ignavibacteria bacterium]HCA43455.1 elongation factor Ts [Bacteroidota bacterium]
MTVTLDLIKELRAKTGVGMADCKKALEETSGDLEKAIEYLRKKGASLAAKRADKMTNEGAVKDALSDDRKKGVIVEINCETDFVAKGDDFQKFSNDVAKTALDNNISDLDSLLKANLNGLSVQETLDGLMGKLGEKIEIKKIENVSAEDGFITDYIHFGSKLGGLVAFKGNKTDESLDLGRKIAMQVVAMNPMALTRDAISSDVVEKEKEIYKTLAVQEGKPENIIDKIVSNKLEKFYQENVLLEQSFLQDEKKTVEEILNEFNKKSGNTLSISKMVRFQLG